MNYGVYNNKSFKTIRKNIAAAGTAEQLHADLPIPDGFGLVVKALDANNGDIEIGETKAIAQGAQPFILKPGSALVMGVLNANAVWLDATVSGEGVSAIVEKN